MSKTIGMSLIISLCGATLAIASSGDLSSSGEYSEEALRIGQAALQAYTEEVLEPARQARALQLEAMVDVIERQRVGQGALLRNWDEAIEITLRGQAALQEDWDQIMGPVLQAKTEELAALEDEIAPENEEEQRAKDIVSYVLDDE